MTEQSEHQINIESEMREAYLSYAMSVIVSRALPDARDGLKPVHRRILYAMHDMGIGAGGAHKKSARIVGEVLGKYHPHGDGAVYETMVRMAQDFSMRYMLIDGQGNFGSIDGDGAAAMRYTEARTAKIGDQLLVDINKQTVDFVENFDGTLNEPAVLPAMAPNLLINGASGIAVGMSTNIPPHNLGEICDALTHILAHWQRLEEIDVDELMQFVKGPDFPTGGVIFKMRGDENTLRQAMATGRGKITLRAKVHIEDMGRGQSRIIVSELPYQTNKTTLVERIASLARAGRLEGLVDLRDESDRQNPVRLVIELKRGVDVTDVLVRLFKLTPLQSTFGIIMLALVDGQPRLLGLKQALRVFLDHRLAVIARRSQYDLARARERAHVLEGLIVALDNLDAVIKTIRKSRTTETARKNLVKNFAVTEIQAGAILEMPLRRLASLEIRRIRDEHKEKLRLIRSLEELLASPEKQRALIAEELAGVKAEFGDRRRTIVSDGEASGVTQADFLMPEEQTVVMLSTRGELGRTHGDEPPKITTGTKQPPRLLQHSTTAQILYLFANDGYCATLPVQQLPQVKQAAEGLRYSALTDLGQKRKIVSFLCLPTELQSGFVCLFTAQGQVKRLHVLDLPGVMSHEFSVMKLSKRDRVVAVLYSSGAEDLVFSTTRGQVIRFNEEDVRPTGLASGGVRGIELKNDRAVAACVVSEKATHFWHIDKRGHASLTELSRIHAQARGGTGRQRGSKELESEFVAAAVGRLNDTCLVVTSRGKAKYMTLGLAGKVTLGPRGIEPVIALRERESVVGVVEYRGRITVPPDDELSLEEIETLLNQADGDDGDVSGSSNGAGPAPRADD
ncbi:MAG: DNA topoisomerase 4 subunit A [Chloroflexi bacterium]|nr:DNA topoisomerase 4 subunit A [Chloroflexota bacterium]